ncbi:hypothetical protein, partial [Caballeronia sp. AAUFL_F3_KS11A]|uniref:hypothetical protein n=1 Tax=Caballeronia sp. AAUFL_F3_KS11A TaxID=2921774 RepID=UPI002027A428
ASRPMSSYGSVQLPEVPEFMELADMMCFVTDIKLVVEILIKYLPKADPNTDAEKNEAGPTATAARKPGKK